MNMNADQFTKPAKLEFEGNVAENYRQFRQQFEIYMSATGFDATNVPKKKQAAILLNIAGEEAIEVFNTFTFAEDEDDPEDILAKVNVSKENPESLSKQAKNLLVKSSMSY